MTLDEPPVNPFRNTAALRPWEEDSGDEELYVAVDHTAEQFRRFVAYLRNPDIDVPAKGRLIVVTGVRGSGKTSLIHRCVNHVKKQMAPGKLRIVDVTRDQRLPSRNADGLNAEPSPDNYFDRLTHHVLTEMTALSGKYADPGPNIVNAASAYARLSATLRAEKDVAAILLPAFLDQVSSPVDGAEQTPVDFAGHPIEEYMRFRHKSIIFFAESRNPAAIDAWYQDLDGDAQTETLVLPLGGLNSDDGWLFASERINLAGDNRIPGVSPATMKNLLANSRSMTLSHLGQLCRELWESAIADNRSEITDEDIRRFYNSRADRFQRRPRPEEIARGRRVERRDEDTTAEQEAALRNGTDDE